MCQTPSAPGSPLPSGWTSPVTGSAGLTDWKRRSSHTPNKPSQPFHTHSVEQNPLHVDIRVDEAGHVANGGPLSL